MNPSLLRASSLTTLAAILLSFGSAYGAFHDGRGEWGGYAWQQVARNDCVADGPLLVCPLYQQKWDWKRDQWVDIAVTLDPASGTLQLSQRLTENDPYDDDYVCVTALALDASGAVVLAHHQNWHMRPGTTREAAFSYSSARLDSVTAIHIGSKQCRDGANQDDALYARVLAGIKP